MFSFFLHFPCGYSDESDDESLLKEEPYLMDRVTLAEGSLLELKQEYQFGIKV